MKLKDEELVTKALSLPPEARAALAGRLLESLEGEVDEGVEAAWSEEIGRRVGELDRGSVKAVPWSEARRQIMSDPDEPSHR